MDHNSKLSHVITSSMFGGFFSGYLINAFEVFKTRILGQAFVSVVPGSRSSSISICTSMIRSEGLSSLFRGSFHMCMTMMIRAPLSIGIYEYSKIHVIRPTSHNEMERKHT